MMSSWYLFIIVLLFVALMVISCEFIFYVKRENQRLAEATQIVQSMIAGNETIRLSCETEGVMSRLFHEINSLASILNAHANNKARSSEFLKETIQDISHQLKTPLAALNIYNGILQDEELDRDSTQKFVALSEQELDRMEILVQNLLKITKLDSQTVQFERMEESAEALLNYVRERFAVRASQEEKILNLDCKDVNVICDREWTLEAICNLVKNSLDHTKKGDTISLKCFQSGEMGCFQVEDNGCGIHEEDLYYIFKRFYRSRYSKDKSGIGLGLPLARSIIENQGGSIEVQSIEGSGATFSVFLPIPTKL